MNDLVDRRAYCRVNGHTWEFEGEEFGTDPSGLSQAYETYVCRVCEKVNYEPVPD